MFKQPLPLSAATAIVLLVFGGTATASDSAESRYLSEIKSCIAEVGDHANYADATRVQHTVEETGRTRLGFAFRIGTSVFNDSEDEAIRKYASYCVARGDDQLVKFSIDEV